MLGNSTDYWPNYVVGVDSPTDDAWPALLEARLRETLPHADVDVTNASVLGAGFDQGLYGVTSMRERLAELSTASATRSQNAPTWLLIAPSVVDLQLRSLDVDGSFQAFRELVADAVASFENVEVVPMNPVADGFDPDVVAAIADFNDRLEVAELLDSEYAVSPLLSDDGVTGRVEFFDDFDDARLDTPGADPDLLHPDRDGHAEIADAMANWLAPPVAAGCT